MPDRIDYSFISGREGGRATIAYVPAAAVSSSGITLATGFDLGQRSESDLVQLGLNGALVARLRPYLGVRGVAAQQLLAGSPLTISGADADDIDRAVMSEHVTRLEQKYIMATANTKRIRFFNLPSEAQTVIASVAFQYGVNLDVRAPRFWRAVTAQDWPQAVSELRTFGDTYPTRRRLEADLLQRIAP